MTKVRTMKAKCDRCHVTVDVNPLGGEWPKGWFHLSHSNIGGDVAWDLCDECTPLFTRFMEGWSPINTKTRM